MEKYLRLKSDIAEFEKNMQLAITTNKLSFLFLNNEIINRWDEKEREDIYNGLKREFIVKHFPSELLEKYVINLNYDFNIKPTYVFQLEISFKHNWVVKKRATDGWLTRIKFFVGGGTEAEFENSSVAKDFGFIKEKSLEMISEILLEYDTLKIFCSGLPWSKLIEKYFWEYLISKNISSIDFPVPVGRKQDTLKYSSYLENTIFGSSVSGSDHGRAIKYLSDKSKSTDWLNINKPYEMITIFSQLMDNDAIKVGDKFVINGIYVERKYLPHATVTINLVNNHIIDYSCENEGEIFNCQDKHISNILTQLNQTYHN